MKVDFYADSRDGTKVLHLDHLSNEDYRAAIKRICLAIEAEFQRANPDATPQELCFGCYSGLLRNLVLLLIQDQEESAETAAKVFGHMRHYMGREEERFGGAPDFESFLSALLSGKE